MTHSSSGQQVQPLGAGGQAGDEGDGKTSSFVQYFYLKCTDFVVPKADVRGRLQQRLRRRCSDSSDLLHFLLYFTTLCVHHS